MRRIRRSPAAPGRRAIDAEASGGCGARYDGPFDGGRVHFKGRVLKWQIGTPTLRGLSFLRGDVTPHPRRFREGKVRVHPNGAQSDGSVTLHVADLDASVARLRALLGPGAAIATRDPRRRRR